MDQGTSTVLAALLGIIGTLLTQAITGRWAIRANDRSVRLDAVTDYLKAAQKVERLAKNRGATLTGDKEKAAQVAMDDLWVSNKMVQAVCTGKTFNAADALTNRLDAALWRNNAWDTEKATDAQSFVREQIKMLQAAIKAEFPK